MKQLLLFILLTTPAYTHAQVRDIEIETDSTVVDINGTDTIIIEKPTFSPEQKKEIRFIESLSSPRFKNDFEHYLQKHLHYPEDARQKKIEGTVVVYFSIDADGSIHKPIIVQSVYPSIDIEALRIIQHIYDWHPVILNHQSIKTDYRLDIPFKL